MTDQITLVPIAEDGLRLPIELYPLDQDPDCPPPDPRDPDSAAVTYGLISGSRRLAAFYSLNEAGPDKYTHIPALIRPFTNGVEAMRHLIAENDLHATIFPWDTGHVINQYSVTDIFDSIDSAITGLFPMPRQPSAPACAPLPMWLNAWMEHSRFPRV